MRSYINTEAISNLRQKCYIRAYTNSYYLPEYMNTIISKCYFGCQIIYYGLISAKVSIVQ